MALFGATNSCSYPSSVLIAICAMETAPLRDLRRRSGLGCKQTSVSFAEFGLLTSTFRLPICRGMGK